MRTLLLVAILTLAIVEPASAQITSLFPTAAGAASSGAPAAAPSTPAATSAATSAAHGAASAAAGPVAAPIALADIALEAQTTEARLRDLAPGAADDNTLQTTKDDLDQLARGTENRIQEVRRLASGRPSLDTLRGLETGWGALGRRAQALTRDLTRRAADLDQNLATVAQLAATWQTTAQAASQQGAPGAVLQKISDIQSGIAAADKTLQAQRASVLALQARSADLTARVTQTQEGLAAESRRAAARLLQRDALPMYQAAYWSEVRAALGTEGLQNAAAQWTWLGTFVGNHRTAVALHGMAFALILAALLTARHKVKAWANEEPDFERAGRVFETPISMAVLLTLVLGRLLDDQQPLVVGEVYGMIAVLPMVLVLRRLIEPYLHPILYVLIGFYIVDRLRGLTAPAPSLARLILLLELSVALVVLAQTLLAAARAHGAAAAPPPRRRRLLRVARVLGLAIAACAWLAGIIGLEDLADLIGTAELKGAYLALVFYALLVIAEGALLGLSHVPPIAYLKMVRGHRRLIVTRCVRLLAWGAAVLWVVVIFQTLGVWPEIAASGSVALDASVSIGSISIVVGRVLGFAVAIVAALWLARFINFALDEEIYPNVHIEPGLPYVISKILRYTVLFAGFVIGLGALGIDMTKFTILAGAFSVGLGFGLQNIVNNFVSGLIVLFERPIKIGDVVQFGDTLGQVERIGIRASVIRAYNGAEVIIPNGTLIANNLTNWTYSNKTRRVDVPIQTALGSDADRVKGIMLDAAHGNPSVAAGPPAQALLTQIGPDALQFELRVWCDAVSDWFQTRSDLASNIEAALRSQGIAFK